MVCSFMRCYFKEAEEDRKVSPHIHIHRVGSIKAYLTEKASIFITSYRTVSWPLSRDSAFTPFEILAFQFMKT